MLFFNNQLIVAKWNTVVICVYEEEKGGKEKIKV